jgi:hypothetical protein
MYAQSNTDVCLHNQFGSRKVSPFLQTTKALWESRGIALLFLDLGTRRGWGVSVTPRPLFTPGKDPGPILEEAGWAPGAVGTGAENLAPLGFDPQPTWPWKSIIYSVCVSVACPALLYFSTLYNEWHNFFKKVSKNKICVFIFSVTVFWNIQRVQQYALICTAALFHALAPTCFSSSLPSSGSLLDPPELLEIQNGRLIYHIMCGYVTCVLDCWSLLTCLIMHGKNIKLVSEMGFISRRTQIWYMYTDRRRHLLFSSDFKQI